VRLETGVVEEFISRDVVLLLLDRFSRRSWLPNRARRKMVLGDDIGLEEVANLALMALVGRFSYRSLCVYAFRCLGEGELGACSWYTCRMCFFFLTGGWVLDFIPRMMWS
jgi:hypothetical protein